MSAEREREEVTDEMVIDAIMGYEGWEKGELREAVRASVHHCDSRAVNMRAALQRVVESLRAPREEPGRRDGELFPLTLSDGSVVSRLYDSGDQEYFRRVSRDGNTLIAEAYDWLPCIIATDSGADHDSLKAAALSAEARPHGK